MKRQEYLGTVVYDGQTITIKPVTGGDAVTIPLNPAMHKALERCHMNDSRENLILGGWYSDALAHRNGTVIDPLEGR